MKHHLNIALFLLASFISALPIEGLSIIRNRVHYQRFTQDSNAILLATPGRSGSTMFWKCLEPQLNGKIMFGCHLLPPKPPIKGKIIFLYSNPNKIAESVLHKTINNGRWGRAHFKNVETSNLKFIEAIGSTENQTLEWNLLNQDALGIGEILYQWLHNKVEECAFDEAEILAIQYEHLWDQEVAEALMAFLDLDTFKLTPYRPRGYSKEEYDPREITFRKAYNVGTEEYPIYHAYDFARSVWAQNPPYHFLKLK